MRTRQEVVKKIARALCASTSPLLWENLPILQQEEYTFQAEAVLETVEELARDGWVAAIQRAAHSEDAPMPGVNLARGFRTR